MKTAVVRIHRHGGPEVLQYEEVDLHEPGPGEVLMRQTAIGLNFSDVYQREGDAGPHESQPMPIVLGGQGAGVVEAVGLGVANFKPGDMVAYIYSGAYAERRTVPAARLLHLRAGISDKVAAATLLRGLTAEYLVRRLYRVKAGDTVLVHAAAGGMGLILGQWASALGAPPDGGPLSAGYFTVPTLFASKSNNWRLAREEIFGPVLVAIPFRGEDDVIQMANDSHYGLAGYVFSNNATRAIRVAHQLDAGWVQVNQGKGQIAGQPYGGFKESGLGKEMSLESMIDGFSRLKTVTINLDL